MLIKRCLSYTLYKSYNLYDSPMFEREWWDLRWTRDGGDHMAKAMKASEVRDDFAETLNQVVYGGERVELARYGKPVAALISIEDLRLLEEMEDRADVAAAKRALAESDERIPYARARRKLGLT